ncbi:MAG: FG-GAP repeat protein [Planctomycetes bacterium]|nr:FG-GAP repeat protein [Planctomycetota bacterium]
MPRLPRSVIFALSVSAVLASTAVAQKKLATLSPPSPSSTSFGFALDRAGDVNHDGIQDLVVGAPMLISGGSSGIAYVFSGVTGNLLWTINKPATAGDFGCSVSGLGDVDADGYDDVIVGARRGASSNGAYYVFSGQTHAILYSGVGVNGEQLGFSVDGLGDVDLDGRADWIVGAPLALGSFLGSARVYSGATGTLLFQIDGTMAGDSLGRCVARTGDVDLDGHADFAVGSVWGQYARIFSGSSGQLIREIHNPQPFNMLFGAFLAGGADVDGDGVPDLAVGDPNSFPDGRALLYSGATGAKLLEYHSVSLLGPVVSGVGYLGSALALGGDANGDGRPDLAIGRSQEVIGLFSPADRSRIHVLADPPIAGYDSAVALFDFDGDGLDDLVSGAPSVSAGVSVVTIYAGGAGQPEPYFCPVKPAATYCFPFLQYTGIASVSGATPFVLTATQVPATVNGLFFYGTNQKWTPFGSYNLCVAPPIIRLAVQDSGGSAICDGTLTFDLGAYLQSGVNPNLVVGSDVHVQAWLRQSTGGSGVAATTNALRITLRP